MSHQEYKPERQLMDMLDFTDADLKANRDGYMSKKQRARLSRTRKNLQQIAIAIISLAIALCVVIIFRDSLASVFSEKLTYTAAICVGTAVITIYCWLHWNELNKDLEKGYVNAAEGLLELYTTTTNRGIVSHHLSVAGTSFDISLVLYENLEVFKQDDPYCAIYYAPFSKTILAIERSLHPRDYPSVE